MDMFSVDLYYYVRKLILDAVRVGLCGNWVKNDVIDIHIKIDQKYAIGALAILCVGAALYGIRKCCRKTKEDESAQFRFDRKVLFVIEYEKPGLDNETFKKFVAFTVARASVYGNRYRSDFKGMRVSFSEEDKTLKIEMERKNSNEIWSEILFDREISEMLRKLRGENIPAPAFNDAHGPPMNTGAILPIAPADDIEEE